MSRFSFQSKAEHKKFPQTQVKEEV